MSARLSESPLQGNRASGHNGTKFNNLVFYRTFSIFHYILFVKPALDVSFFLDRVFL